MSGTAILRTTLRAAAFAAMLAGSSGAAKAQGATLLPLGTVRLQVLDWDAVEQAVRDWPALSGEYRIDAQGLMTVPFIEPIPTAGLDAGIVAGMIADRLRERFALSEAPVATLVPVDLPTIVVGGMVREPGAIEFRPGMTVRHAVALAGGLDEVLTPGTSAMRDYVESEAQLRILDDRLRRQNAVLARLEAERAGTGGIVRPAALASPEDDALMAEQAEILERRRASQMSDLDALAEQIDLFRAEVASLEAKVAATERQRDLSRELFENAQSLAERGLARNDRLVDAERSLISAENQLLDISTAILRARQAISVAIRERETLVAARLADVAQQILDLRGELVETEARLAATERLVLLDADRTALAMSDPEALPAPRVTLYREGPGAAELEANLDTVLMAGDLVSLALPGAVAPMAATGPAALDIN